MRSFRIGPAACVAAAALVLCSSRCSFLEAPHQSTTILSYNLQTLFDDRDDGTEYSGWSVASGEWDSAGYRRRLRNLSEAILAAVPGGPDVLVLQEVENQRAANDLADLLRGGYRTRVVSGDAGQALRCAVLSKFALQEARAHSVLPEPEAGDVDGLRPLLEVALDANGVRLTILAAHWKSKLGGAEVTERLRRAQAGLAARRLTEILKEDPNAEVVLVGDLNENPDEWTRVSGSYPTALLPAASTADAPEYADRLLLAESPEAAGVGPEGVALWSPWEEYGGYSYVYGGAEERIDHMLLAPGLFDDVGLRFRGFASNPPEKILTEDGVPWKWNTRDEEGYSDHLPIRMELVAPNGR